MVVVLYPLVIVRDSLLVTASSKLNESDVVTLPTGAKPASAEYEIVNPVLVLTSKLFVSEELHDSYLELDVQNCLVCGGSGRLALFFRSKTVSSSFLDPSTLALAKSNWIFLISARFTSISQF